LNSEFIEENIQLSKRTFQRQAYSIVQAKVNFRNNKFINAAYLPKWDPGMKITTYDVSDAFNTIFPVSESKLANLPKNDVNPQDTYFSM
jgi:hypothetical protein